MIITLTTDFGLEDHFVGVMKGVILSLAPDAAVVDLSHQIPPQNVKRAYLLLQQSYTYFPPDTLHVAVIDPTVGSERRILLVKAFRQRFLAPDNGLLSFIPPAEIREIYAIHAPRYSLPKVSQTFHGRDVFAPIAGYLHRQVPASELGSVIQAETMVKIDVPNARSCDQCVQGEVLYVDHFGNLVTNIGKHMLPANVNRAQVILGKARIALELNKSVRQHSYSQAAPGVLLALFNSSDLLEIACNMGNAAHLLEAGEGSQLACSWENL